MMQSIEDSYSIDDARSGGGGGAHQVQVQAHHHRNDGGDEEDGVWDIRDATTTPASSRPCCGDRKGVVTAVVGTVLVVVIIVAFAAASGNQNSSVSSSSSNSDMQGASTTLAPPATTFDVTPPTTAASNVATTTTASTASSSYNCDTGNILEQREELKTNHFLCSDNRQYRFGMDDTGSLIFADDVANETTVLYNDTHGDQFYLTENGTFTVENNNDQVVWTQNCSEIVTFSGECIGLVDKCPYLHLHDGGKLMLHYMEKEGKAVGSNVLHVYNLTSCDDNDFICDS